MSKIDVHRPLRIPRDPDRREALYQLANLPNEQRLAMEQWCAEEQRKYENGRRHALENMEAESPHA